eukprot:1771781-Rhodomonas_salina.2
MTSSLAACSCVRYSAADSGLVDSESRSELLSLDLAHGGPFRLRQKSLALSRRCGWPGLVGFLEAEDNTICQLHCKATAFTKERTAVFACT